jgi:hypothetical protein
VLFAFSLRSMLCAPLSPLALEPLRGAGIAAPAACVYPSSECIRSCAKVLTALLSCARPDFQPLLLFEGSCVLFVRKRDPNASIVVSVAMPCATRMPLPVQSRPRPQFGMSQPVFSLSKLSPRNR